MPYNSSSFEKQLARHKAAEAVKKVADMPLNDPHQVRSRVAASTGTLKPHPAHSAALSGGEGLSSTAMRLEKPEKIDPVIITKRKKPFYRRVWFNFIFFSVVSTASMPVFFPGEMAQLKEMLGVVKQQTGMDPLAVSTYTTLIRNRNTPQAPVPSAMDIMDGKPRPATAPVAATPIASTPVASNPVASNPAEPTPLPVNPADMPAVMDAAHQRAQAAAMGGAEHSMKYIESETKRLEEMARELQRQSGVR